MRRILGALALCSLAFVSVAPTGCASRPGQPFSERINPWAPTPSNVTKSVVTMTETLDGAINTVGGLYKAKLITKAQAEHAEELANQARDLLLKLTGKVDLWIDGTITSAAVKAAKQEADDKVAKMVSLVATWKGE